ncbi:MAG: PstS family phosphate ABC transporter substrate-binding protein [Mycoplasma sp.]
MSLLKNRNLKKWIIGCTAVVVTAVPITLLSINWTNLQILYVSGSSAVAPLMMDLSETYTKTYKQFGLNKKIELNISVTGSGTGLESAVNGSKHMGNVSWAPSHSKINTGDNLKAWKEKGIKTFTLGIDGIGLIYKPKAGNDFDLNINKEKAKLLYSAMAGVNEYSYGDLIGTNNNLKIIPYARAGGAAKSGTTDAFLKDNGLSIDGHKKEPYYNMLDKGNYGSNVKPTRESNVETWNQISSGGGEEGAMTYLSAGFILNNYDKIQSQGFKVATYNTNIEMTIENIANGTYKWYRPLNTLVSINDNNQNIKSWIEWFYNNYQSQEIQETITKAGVVPLTPEQLEELRVGNDYWKSDFDKKDWDPNDESQKWGVY